MAQARTMRGMRMILAFCLIPGTEAAVIFSLAPIVQETGIGSGVMKPIAVPTVGGMVTSTIHVLIVVPVFFLLIKRRSLPLLTLPTEGEKRYSPLRCFSSAQHMSKTFGGDSPVEKLFEQLLFGEDCNCLV
jgi:hypothetical protein